MMRTVWAGACGRYQYRLWRNCQYPGNKCFLLSVTSMSFEQFPAAILLMEAWI